MQKQQASDDDVLLDITSNLPPYYKPTDKVINADSFAVHDKSLLNVAHLKSDLQKRGWALFKPMFNTEPFIMTSKRFFSEKNEAAKQNHIMPSYQNRFGYFSTDYKEGYRYMTVNYAKKFGFPIESGLYEQVSQTDNILRTMWYNFGKELFEPKHDVEHVPLIAVNPKYKRFGLFDIVNYFPTSKLKVPLPDPAVQVHAHADPGLWSLSIGSTAEGLQMYDPESVAWVKIPKDTFVLWCGFAAEELSGNGIKSGVHRIVSSDVPRLTAWYEMCTDQQVPMSILTNTEPTEEEKRVEKVLFEMEKKRGLSMSKRRPPPRFKEDTFNMKEPANNLSQQLLKQ